MLKKIVAMFLMSISLTMTCTPVLADEVGTVGDTVYVDGENGGYVEDTPAQEDETIAPEEAEPGKMVGQDTISEEEYFKENGIVFDGSDSNSNNNMSTTTTEETPIKEGKGWVYFTSEGIPSSLKENIMIKLMDRDTGKTIDCLVYAENKWKGKAEIPAGSYMVYNIQVSGDDALNPKWIFTTGDLFNLDNEGTKYITIKLEQNLNDKKKDEHEKQPEKPEEITNTDLSDEDRQGSLDTKTVPQILLGIVKRLFSGANLILYTIAGSAGFIYYRIQKKKREDQE